MNEPVLHAFRDDALGDADGVELARRIADGEVSATEVIEAVIARAEIVEPLAAVVVDAFERAMIEASSHLPAAGRGAFAGVPTFIKDQIDVAGLPTRYGSDAHPGHQPAKRNDPIAQQLFDMGMICAGKSTLPEYGFVPSTEFPSAAPTRNPWNPARTAGGSSGGAAVLVAGGVVPIAHAADGGGSIRIPASCCGLVGLKPSRGRLPHSGMHEPFVGLVTDGVVSRSVRDTAVYLAEAERLDPAKRLAPIGLVTEPSPRPLRIGVVTESPTGATLDAPTVAAVRATAEVAASLGHHVEDYAPPIDEQFAADFALYWSTLALLTRETARLRLDRHFDKAALARFTHGLADNARASLRDLPGAVRRLRASKDALRDVHPDLDVVLSPTVGQVPPELGELTIDQEFEVLLPKLTEWTCFTPLANATGAPAVSLPLGFDDATRLPIGVMFSADLGRERTLLELALQLEQAAPFRRIQDQG
ncbi:MAG: amidase [Acidimicrobiia bacterium]|nr:amidase [Acidimicrobiia bacterium]